MLTALPRRQRILLARDEVRDAIRYLAAELPERDLSPDQRELWSEIQATLHEALQGLEQLHGQAVDDIWSEDDR